uniref:F-box domain-containing protein n=1 Tax=Rhizophagus irregularis (strain DAOM 181602 / DAOM 197198 / MUCL 43194) TaxID=747089 RepID=U9SZW3_RHIID
MACSKFFSGDLSELLNEVIQYFHYDYKTLHSCILVNRLWCRLAISLLWEDPFSIKSPKNYRFIEIYLCNLSDDDKTRLNEYVIHSGLFSSNTLFNYPKFIKHLDIYKVYDSIETWAYTNLLTSPTSQILDFIIELIFRSLFIIFIENEVNLHSFGVIVDGYKEFECFGAAFELVLQNTNFVYNIKSLTLDFDSEITDNITKFLEFLCSNCNSISSLYFLLPIINNGHPIIKKNLSQMIKLQKNLKKISFSHNCPLSLLLLLKNSNCSNTLNTIIFYSIDFKNMNFLSELFNQLNVLESIHIVDCYSLDSGFIQQINNVTKPFKLRSLFLDKMDELLDPLIQKSGNYLENFKITKCKSLQLSQSLELYCSNIKFLYVAKS